MDKKKLGNFGEDIACRYLSEHGYKIKGRNIRLHKKEIDIIANTNTGTIFFEIKTRLKNGFSEHDSLISGRQMKTLKKAALAYAALNRLEADKIHFHLIAIIFDDKTGIATLKHYENIF